MIALITTARKATLGAATAFLTPLYVLYQSDVEITGRALVACLIGGLIAGLGVYEAKNTRPYGEHSEREG